MFELVVGEIDMILGRLQGDQEFSDMVYELWVTHPEETERKKAFNALAARIKRARTAYESSKELDEKLFREDFEYSHDTGFGPDSTHHPLLEKTARWPMPIPITFMRCFPMIWPVS